jgi:hypothetical protein
VGVVLATGIGVCILPMTLLGLLLIVGFLGTMPFLTAIVYLRNVISARRVAFAGPNVWFPRLMFAVGIASAIGLPFVLYQAYAQEIAEYFHSLPNYGLRWL